MCFIERFLKRTEQEDNQAVAMVTKAQPKPKKKVVVVKDHGNCGWCGHPLNEKKRCDNDECVPF
jgi:hypothetical protein